MKLKPQFLVNKHGEKKSVLLSMDEWAYVVECLEDLADIRASDEATSKPEEVVPLEKVVRESETTYGGARMDSSTDRAKSEIIFEIEEDHAEGGWIASALGAGITTQAETIDELKDMMRDALRCHFDDEDEIPRVIRLHFVRDEVISFDA